MNSTPETNKIDMEAILSSMSKRRADARSGLKLNRDRILKSLKALKVTRAVVSYSGSGDSGQIDAVDLYKGDEKVEPKRRVSVFQQQTRWNADTSSWDIKLKRARVPIIEALRELVYDWLEAEHGGWENNDGASGECVIDVTEECFLLEHTSYYTESTYSESAL